MPSTDFPDSELAQYSCACVLLLIFLGLATFGALSYFRSLANEVQLGANKGGDGYTKTPIAPIV